ncbi:MAG: methylglyoxal synthase [Oscillospiraceae bacterium]|nr:methylglyoxal synthase [Oscillospiraceae bacterium]
MTIALIAHETKKELLAQFCIAYRAIFAANKICATEGTARVVSEATGLKVERYLSGTQGGIQQIISRISCNQIDILFFFRDPRSLHENNREDDIAVLRMCDVHTIPMATNLATAEALINALGRGDFDWMKSGRVNL